MFRWLFGGSGEAGPEKPKDPEAKSREETLKVLSSGVSGDKVDLSNTKFDPALFERIANAARELQKNAHAPELLELAKQQEVSWQAKFKAAEAEAKAKEKQLEGENIAMKEAAQHRILEDETKQQNQRAHYADQLARKRYDDQLRQQQEVNQRQLQMQEQSLARQEQERRKTVEYEQELRQRTELLKVRAETEARIKQERENRDIREQQLLLEAREKRATVLQAIEAAGRTIGDGISAYLSDYEKLGTTVAAITALAIGIYAARSTTSVTAQYISNRLQKPPLIRETSRISALLHPWKRAKLLLTPKKADSLEGIILKPDLQSRLRGITIATANTRRNGAHFRHLMLHGPPGTGKTLFARRLAQQSGLEYALLAGGDVGPLGNSAVTEMHRIFDWANSSSRGMLLFVDEADSFLRKRGARGDGHMSEAMRNVLSTFLYRTGDPTKKFMLVFASNEPSAFDPAVMDRVDEVLYFSLPGLDERKQILRHYFNEYIVKGTRGARKIVVDDDVTQELWDHVAAQTEGFSGRALNKLCSGFQHAAYGSVDNVLNSSRVKEVLAVHLAAHAKRHEWEEEDLKDPHLTPARSMSSLDKPEPHNTVFVGGLSANTEEAELRDVAEKFGTVTSVSVNKGYGFITFVKSRDAAEFIQLNKKMRIGDADVELSFAKRNSCFRCGKPGHE